MLPGFLAACSGSSLLNVHRPPIEQGNLYDRQDIEKLRKGMTQEQVRYIMGTPMIRDPFNQSRWDYYYSFANNRNHIVKRHHLVLYFEDNELIDINEPLPVAGTATKLRAQTELRQRDDDALLLDQ
jgi:outer membrane protein assembly factor BamE